MRLLLITGFGFGFAVWLQDLSLVHLFVSVIQTASVFRVRGAGERFEGLKLPHGSVSGVWSTILSYHLLPSSSCYLENNDLPYV